MQQYSYYSKHLSSIISISNINGYYSNDYIIATLRATFIYHSNGSNIYITMATHSDINLSILRSLLDILVSTIYTQPSSEAVKTSSGELG